MSDHRWWCASFDIDPFPFADLFSKHSQSKPTQTAIFFEQLFTTRGMDMNLQNMLSSSYCCCFFLLFEKCSCEGSCQGASDHGHRWTLGSQARGHYLFFEAIYFQNVFCQKGAKWNLRRPQKRTTINLIKNHTCNEVHKTCGNVLNLIPSDLQEIHVSIETENYFPIGRLSCRFIPLNLRLRICVWLVITLPWRTMFWNDNGHGYDEMLQCEAHHAHKTNVSMQLLLFIHMPQLKTKVWIQFCMPGIHTLPSSFLSLLRSSFSVGDVVIHYSFQVQMMLCTTKNGIYPFRKTSTFSVFSDVWATLESVSEALTLGRHIIKATPIGDATDQKYQVIIHHPKNPSLSWWSHWCILSFPHFAQSWQRYRRSRGHEEQWNYDNIFVFEWQWPTAQIAAMGSTPCSQNNVSMWFIPVPPLKTKVWMSFQTFGIHMVSVFSSASSWIIISL